MAEQLYWHDIEDLQGQWVGLGVTVERPASARPPLHLLTGHNGRIKLMLHDTPLFWATVAQGYCGAWLVRNPVPAQLEFLPIPPIDSAQVERHAPLEPQQRIKAWSRFFVSQLSERSADFLYPGRWLAQGMLPNPANARAVPQRGLTAWSFSSGTGSHSHLPHWSLYGEDILDNLQPETVQWIDWWQGGGKLVGLHPVDPLAGRLKWWRKKAREGSLPPILLWHVGGLASYVIVDGHYRLQAALDENIPPTFIVLSATRIQAINPCPENQQRVLDSLMMQSTRNPNFDVDTLNRALINTFDNRPYYNASTHSWVGIESDQTWVDEVTQYLHQEKATEHLQAIIERCE
ncbi:hypothetical protein [Pseudomonas chlororaphis]|uniref:hypothetical protein n=1 Tax=Pseudomonas chlororaphis TaxID=587753 RepID=UPI000BE333C6|nr:hypothetical protein [Pseudomonas chlororaphis]